jgi:hypothetical protein
MNIAVIDIGKCGKNFGCAMTGHSRVRDGPPIQIFYGCLALSYARRMPLSRIMALSHCEARRDRIARRK